VLERRRIRTSLLTCLWKNECGGGLESRALKKVGLCCGDGDVLKREVAFTSREWGDGVSGALDCLERELKGETNRDYNKKGTRTWTSFVAQNLG